MRLLFVNYAHPETRHISGVRLWRFAQELAKLGHRIIHVTSTHADDVGVNATEAVHMLTNHNWTTPLLIPIKPARSRLLAKLRQNQLHRSVRKLGTAYVLTVKGGVFYDWSDAAERALAPVLQVFLPQAVYGTFGNSSNLFLAMRLSVRNDAALILDFKDSVSNFIPRLARRQFARRYMNASAFTANARMLAAEAEQYFTTKCDVIYSGVDQAFYSPPAAVPAAETGNSKDVFTLTGSLYSLDRLRDLMESMSDWRQAYMKQSGREVCLHYIGGEHEQVAGMATALRMHDWVQITPYLPVTELATQCRLNNVRANIYIKGSPFHHKLLELIATGLPVIAYGGESEESISLAASCGSNLLITPMNGQELHAALSSLMNQCGRKAIPKSHFGWDVQAKKLEAVMRRVTGLI